MENPKSKSTGAAVPPELCECTFQCRTHLYRGWVHPALSAPACRGAALTHFGAPRLGESLSPFWQAFVDEDLCLNSG